MPDIAERVEEAWTELASRLDLTGKHCGWFKSWLTEILERERALALREAAAEFSGVEPLTPMPAGFILCRLRARAEGEDYA